MFPMTVTINNPAQLSAVMLALNVEQIEVKPLAAKVEKAPGVKKEAAKAEVKDAPQAETQTAVEQKPETLTQMPASKAENALDGVANRRADAPTYLDTADAVTKLARAKGRDTAVAVLSKFGAAKLPDVKSEQFAAVIAACEEAGV